VPTDKQNRFAGPGGRVFCAAKTRRELFFSLGSPGFRRGERGEKDWSWKKRRSPLRGRRYQCLFWQAEGPSVWAWDRIIDFFINEFGDEPYILIFFSGFSVVKFLWFHMFSCFS
jgi:hypothetical protein